jgi:GNAT superfamily N-acetyltransferase
MLVRPAQPEDALAVAGVHVRSWQVAYRGLLPDSYLDQLRPEDRATRYDFAGADPLKPYTVVAAEGAEILGFATTAPSRDEELPDYGELYALYVDPQHWDRRVGVALIQAARARLLTLGFTDAFLWLLEGNSRGRRFYRMDGWAPDGRQRVDSVWDVTVSEHRYVRRLRPHRCA